MGKDWIGDKNSVYKTLGSSHHSKEEREENDYYATEPRAVELLLQLETFNHYIWEPACGEGHIAKVLEAHGHKVVASDLINRGYGIYGIDFFNHQDPYLDNFAGDIITNPPYSKAKEFIQKALDFLPDGSKIAMFLKVQFMEGKGRKQLFLNTPPPHTIYVSSSRLNCAKNGDFTGLRTSGGSAVAYAWYIWIKGYKGETTLKWFN